jgi:hypothetical protein
MMPVGERALASVQGEVRAQPQLLGRPLLASADILAVGVELDDVPGTQAEAVLAPGWGACGRAEVAEVAEVAGCPRAQRIRGSREQDG